MNASVSDMITSDNTNADVETRKYWINLAQDFGVPIRCIRFTASARLCEHNDSVRALNPKLVRVISCHEVDHADSVEDSADPSLCVDEPRRSHDASSDCLSKLCAEISGTKTRRGIRRHHNG